jgi:hypothetical protein
MEKTMAFIKSEIRSGVYYDSVVLMKLQRSLSEQSGILDAGVVMGTDANKDVLEQSNLLIDEVKGAGANDLIIVVKGEDESSAQTAIAKVDELVAECGSGIPFQKFGSRSNQIARVPMGSHFRSRALCCGCGSPGFEIK